MSEKFKVEDYKEYPLKEETLMGAWYLPEYVTDKLIKFSNEKKENKEFIKGTISYTEADKKGAIDVVDDDYKNSYDFRISPSCYDPPFGLYRFHLHHIMLLYQKKYKEIHYCRPFNIIENYNFQFYEKGGGFKAWHFENEGTGIQDLRNNIMNKKNVLPNFKRFLVFMTYLDDLGKEGGTEFKYQNLIIPCKKGLTLFWPAYFTHTHRGVVHKTKEKNIITGWYSYNE